MATSKETLLIEVRSDGVRVVKRDIEEIGSTARRSSDGIFTLRNALRTLGLAAFARELIRLTDAFTNVQNRLTIVTKSSGELRAVTDELFKVSRRTRTAFEQNAELYNRLALATRGYGLSQQDLLDITESLNKAVITAGLGVREANNGIIQLSQGLASGRLNGDELRSVLEQLPPVADVIAKELGVTRGELRLLGRQGKITTDVIIRAFQNAEAEIDAKFAKTVPTIGQSLTLVRNAMVRWIGEMNQATGLSSLLSRAIILLADNFNLLAAAVTSASTAMLIAFAPSGIGKALEWTRRQVDALTVAMMRNPILAIAAAVLFLTTTLYQLRNQIKLTQDGVVSLGDYAGAVFEDVGPLVMGALQTIWDAIKDVAGGVYELLQPLFDGIGELARPAVSAIRGIIGEVEPSLAGAMVATARLLDALLGLVRGTMGATAVIIQAVPDMIRESFVDAVNAAIDELKALPVNIARTFAGVVSSVARQMGRVPDIIVSSLGSVVFSVIDDFTTLMRFVQDNLPRSLGQAAVLAAQMTLAPFALAIQDIKTRWGGLPSVLKDIMITAANGVIIILENMINSFVRGFARIGVGVAVLGQMFMDFVNSLRGIPDALARIFMVAMEKIKAMVAPGINTIIGWFNKIPYIDIPLVTYEATDATLGNILTLEGAVEGVASRFSSLWAEGSAAIDRMGDPVRLGRIANDYEGTAQRVVANVRRIFEEGFSNPWDGAAGRALDQASAAFTAGTQAGGNTESWVNRWLSRARERAAERLSTVDLTTPGDLYDRPDVGGRGAAGGRGRRTREEFLASTTRELEAGIAAARTLDSEIRAVEFELARIDDRLLDNRWAPLTTEERALMSERVALLQEEEAIMRIRDGLYEDLAMSEINFARGQQAVNQLLDAGAISSDQAARAMRQLRYEMLSMQTDSASGLERGLLTIMDELEDDATRAEQAIVSLWQQANGPLLDYEAGLAAINRLESEHLVTLGQKERMLRDLEIAYLDTMQTAEAGFQRGLLRVQQMAADTAGQIEQALSRAFQNAEDALIDFIDTGKLDLHQFFDDLWKDITRMQIRQNILAPIAERLKIDVPGVSPSLGSSPGNPMWVAMASGVSGAAGAVGGVFGPGWPSISMSTDDIFSEMKNIFQKTNLQLDDAFTDLISGMRGAFSSGLSGLMNIFNSLSNGGGSGLSSIISTIASFLPGFANGASLSLAAGGLDSQVAAFRVSPNERIDITPSWRANEEKRSTGGGDTFIFQVDVHGDPDASVEEKVRTVLREEAPALVVQARRAATKDVMNALSRERL